VIKNSSVWHAYGQQLSTLTIKEIIKTSANTTGFTIYTY